MPELPEVETIRIYLHKHLIGNTISHIEVLNLKSFIGDINDVIGKTIIDTYRKGKVLNMKLNNGTYLNVHLKMSGQLLYNGVISKNTRVILTFTDKSLLIFNDMRKFGWVKHTKVPEGTNAPDITRPEFTLEYFTKILKASKKPIKTLLLDQEKIAGIGNIYANDSLFIAKINPFRLGNTLTVDEIKVLYQAIIDIIQEALLHKGTSASEVYVSPDGAKGSYQHHFKVYSREGEPCLNCGTKITRVKQGGRSSFYCPVCQPNTLLQI